jgi:pimeloyl-ACP methyl ester carboxylesterase
MDRIISKDGTPIAYDRRGSGQPLVLVHGMSATTARWSAVMSGFAERFTVYAVERRGRGESGDGELYTIEQEFGDVAALIDSIGEPVNLLGHSYGGTIALQAALLTQNLRTLVLYEPSIFLCRSVRNPAHNIGHLRNCLENDDREGLVDAFLERFIRVTPEELVAAKAAPGWADRLAVAHTIPRELWAQEFEYCFEPTRFEALTVPTLLLVGSDTDHDLKAGAETLNGVLPNSRFISLPGQKHVAMETAPELFLREVLRFLSAGKGSEISPCA